MKVWLVGCGRWGSKILKTLENNNYNVSVIDIKNQTSINDIDTLDPVIVASPPAEHYNQVKSLLLNGNDVFVEKPAAQTVEQCQSLDAIAKQNNKVLMPGHLFMYHPLMLEIENILQSNLLGKIKFIHNERSAMGFFQTSTTVIENSSPHDFSIIQRLLGNITVTDAKGFGLSVQNQHDRISVFGRDSDVDWQIDLSWRSPTRRRLITIYCEQGQVVWDESQSTVEIFYNSTDNGQLIVSKENEVIHNINKRTPLELELDHFFDCVKSKSQPKYNMSQAISVARAIESSSSFLQTYS